MNDRWIGIISLVSGLFFGTVGTFISLQPSSGELELKRLTIGKTVHAYIDDVERISKLEDAEKRLETLNKFETKISYLKIISDTNITALFKQIGVQRTYAEQQIEFIAKTQDEEEKARVLAEQRAEEQNRHAKIEAEKKAAQNAIHRILERERICFNTACTQWILP